MKEKILGYALGIGIYLLRRVLMFDLGVIILVGLSFLVWPPFSATAFSERLIWTGLGIGMVAGVLALSETVGGRNYGIPTYTAAQSSTLIDWNIEIRKNIESRFDFRFRIFLIGVFAFLTGLLVNVIFP